MKDHIAEAAQAATHASTIPPVFLIDGSGFGITALIAFLMYSAWVALGGNRG